MRLVGYCFTQKKGKQLKDRGDLYFRYNTIEDLVYILVDTKDKLPLCIEKAKNIKLEVTEAMPVVDYHDYT